MERSIKFLHLSGSLAGWLYHWGMIFMSLLKCDPLTFCSCNTYLKNEKWTKKLSYSLGSISLPCYYHFKSITKKGTGVHLVVWSILQNWCGSAIDRFLTASSVSIFSCKVLEVCIVDFTFILHALSSQCSRLEEFGEITLLYYLAPVW